jgi:hypothetical protein
VRVHVHNGSEIAQQGTLNGSIEGISFSQPVSIPARTTQAVEFTPAAYPQLVLEEPRPWWPNGYGTPELYTLHLSFETDDAISDKATVPFGIRELSYHVGPKEGPADIRFPSRTARYVRLHALQRASEAGFSVRGLEVYGTASGATDLALKKPAFASTSVDNTVPANAVDANPATLWSSAHREPEWLEVDLETLCEIDRVRVNWDSAYARRYAIQVSSDGATWTDAATVENSQLQVLVNGRKIFCAGGNWGMDDAMKRMTP